MDRQAVSAESEREDRIRELVHEVREESSRIIGLGTVLSIADDLSAERRAEAAEIVRAGEVVEDATLELRRLLGIRWAPLAN
jgi:hypothetical protein